MRDLHTGDEGRKDRLAETFVQLLGLNLNVVEAALDRAAALLLDGLDADRIDILSYEAASDSLVIVATSSTPPGRWRCASDARRVALADGGPAVEAFRSGRAFIAGQPAADLTEVSTPSTDLDAVTFMVSPIRVDGVHLGVIRAVNARAKRFSQADLSFLDAAGRWLGLVMDRGDLLRRLDDGDRAGVVDGATSQRLSNLTPTQREVAWLIVGGFTDAQIAQWLAISAGAVDGHVQRIFDRLDVRSRTQVAALAVGIRLLEPVHRRDGHG